MSQRSYLSIGDVLSLLREEFPDVTISKIRFLESQGLVDPERSPSGYRKFFDHDVARLRWVLRAQRDQFLPLKVIRDRLAAAGNGVPPDEAWTGVEAVAVEEEDEDADGRAEAEAAVRKARSEAARERVLVSSSGASAAPVRDPEPEPAEAPAAPEVEDEPAASTSVTPAPTPAPPGSRATRRAHAAPDAGATETPEPRRSPPPATPVARQSRPAHGRADALGPSMSGVSLTVGELCAATGLSEKIVNDLQSLGLIAPIAMAGGAFYDEEALVVGKLAADFARYGIEPRHLRLYRNAVDREVGLVEQVVTPLLRQRNPEARQRAVEAASELARLGQNLRASLVRTELRRELGG